MRKLVLFQHVSLDGISATPDGGLEWISYDDELVQYADTIVATVGNPIYGRVTFEMMKSYWPGVLKDPEASERDIKHAKWLNGVEKFVVSKTLKNEDWENTTVIDDNIVEAIKKLKEDEGRDLVTFGSPSLAKLLMEEGLIDELQFSVSPIILGQGKSPYGKIKTPLKLKLLSSKIFQSGAFGLHYTVI